MTVITLICKKFLKKLTYKHGELYGSSFTHVVLFWDKQKHLLEKPDVQVRDTSQLSTEHTSL